jgi:hypothetical protein
VEEYLFPQSWIAVSKWELFLKKMRVQNFVTFFDQKKVGEF